MKTLDIILRLPRPGAPFRTKHKRWSPADKQRLENMVGLGFKNARLASEFGLKSPDCVTITLRRFGLTRWRCTRWSNLNIARLRSCVAAGISNREIAARTNISIKRVEQLLHQHGIRRK